MKKICFLLVAWLCACASMAQNCYWVFLTDKAGTHFDPYSYFDAKAIERYNLCGANLYDITNYPLSDSYVQQVNALAMEEVGQSRWLNAVAVMATAEQAMQIEALPCVQRTELIASEMQIAAYKATAMPEQQNKVYDTTAPFYADQLQRMQGTMFKQHGIDGKGIRIAVFDGGFPRVNTHVAFKHLRDNNQIIATWNFCNKKEDVYGWNSHGTMVLSCIAGIIGDKQLGLATGSTFLLARTEVEAEPYKEEVWWTQAMEWADKNGADVINSSLGYGKDRHYVHEMDGRSTVAKAANMAARKGMLVCNSAGNEGSDGKWKTILTPADADSILTVGGISPALELYERINFSSFGPTADGRMKPNVCSYGQAAVAGVKNDSLKTSAFGTSFSSPLVAGFCACAWQTRKGLTAMQMKEEVEKSADLYPYYDYAFGYGVPQASYFVNNKKQQAEQPTFVFEDRDNYVLLTGTGYSMPRDTFYCSLGTAVTVSTPICFNLLMKVSDSNGLILTYYNISDLRSLDKNNQLLIHKGGLLGKTLTVFYDGYTEEYTLSPEDYSRLKAIGEEGEFYYALVDSAEAMLPLELDDNVRKLSDNKIRKLGNKYFIEGYLGFGRQWATASQEEAMQLSCPFSVVFGLNYQYAFSRAYRLGLGMIWNGNNFVMNPDIVNPIDEEVNSMQSRQVVVDKKVAHYTELGAELFQRVRFRAGGDKLGLTHNGTFWDLGVYGSFGWTRYELQGGPIEFETIFKDLSSMEDYKFNWGVTTRFVRNVWGIYGRYRLNNIGGNAGEGKVQLPRLQIGLLLDL